MTTAVICLILLFLGLGYSIYIVKIKQNPSVGEQETASAILTTIIVLMCIVIGFLIKELIITIPILNQ